MTTSYRFYFLYQNSLFKIKHFWHEYPRIFVLGQMTLILFFCLYFSWDFELFLVKEWAEVIFIP